MAGWGGYDELTDAALGAFVEAFESATLNRERFSFGLGAVVFPVEGIGSADPSAARGEERGDRIRQANRNLVARLRELGLDRVVYATDWPAWPPGSEPDSSIERNLELIRSALPLADEEMDQVLTNVGVLFESRF